jgi:hypothetical protein
MITVCSVTVNEIDQYLPIFEESIVTRTKLVSEVLIAKADAPLNYQKTWENHGIKFHIFGTLFYNHRLEQGEEHGIGLHECFKKSSNEYLMTCDPDIFFYKPVDEFYYNLLEKHKLQVVGISHCSSIKFCYTFFPNIMNLMLRKRDLPEDDFLKDKIYNQMGNGNIKLHGRWLIRIKIPETVQEFPNPEGEFDTGCYLCYYAKLNNWQWLSFQTMDIHTYCPMHNRGTLKFKTNDKQKFLYHATSSTCPTGHTERFISYMQAWKKSND